LQTKQLSNVSSRLYNFFNLNGSSRKNGFTLVELLIVIVVGLIITAGVISIMWIYVFDFEQTDDITAARQRGEMVLSILEGPILHAGLGMPNASPDFADSFNNFSGLSGMDSPISPDNGTAEEIYICYSVPSSNVVINSHDFTADTSFDIVLNSSIDDAEVKTTDIRSWITFPTSNVPFHVSSITTATKTLKISPYADGSKTIAQYDELHYVRALRARVKDDGSGKKVFYTEDLSMGTGEQPRVDGVEQIYFKNEDGVLSVYVLTRGNKKDVGLDNPRAIPGWPSGISIDNESYKYRLSVTKGSWRIRN
jgi:prepilin-type N-terminal cleavage/methylation domain-containing protein